MLLADYFPYMKLTRLNPLLVFCCFVASPAFGQFYAPDTEYHDPVQRVYVVEAARVLAWLADRHGTNFAEVTYHVTTKPDQTVSWEIHWLDQKGKDVKLATVTYTGDDLKKGPEFYRSIFKQLCLADGQGLMPLKAEEVRQRFWTGAAKMGRSREESLARVFQLLPREPGGDCGWQPELAGLLAHTTLPGTIDRVTLDWVILARSAAWLALVEQASSTKMDDLWSPILFQAGRERMAVELWNKSRPAKLEKATVQETGWNIWLRKPTSREVYLFAAPCTNLAMAMPMLVYDAAVNDSKRLLADLFPELVDSPQQAAAFHNYAPFMATGTSVSGGHILEGAWPVFARADWVKVLSAYKDSPCDYHGYTNLLQEAQKTAQINGKLETGQDPSLVGFRQIAPLLRLAHTEGVGPLSPTPAVTARDLLNYGWEMNGLQMGSRYSFVAYLWGVPELAKGIFETVTGELDGLMPFFRRPQDANIYNYDESLKRLQMVVGFFHRVGFSTPPFDSKVSQLETAHLFVKRWWLRPCDFEWQTRVLWDAGAIGEIPDLMNTLQTEGGALATVEVLQYLETLNNEALAKIPHAVDLKYQFAETLPQPTRLYVRCVYDRKFKTLGNLERGQEMEKLYWKNPDCGMEDRVFRNYAVSGAFKSAKRFYTQARTNIIDPVGFSNRLGLMVFVTAYLLNDEGMRQMVLEDSRSASFNDMCLHIWDAAIHDNSTELEQNVRALIERYETQKGPESRGRRLLEFLPLLPALRDPQHADHQKALQYFGRDDSWLVLRWLWIEKFNLKSHDAITFLGGRETDLCRHVLVCYLDRDEKALVDATNQFLASRDTVDEFSVLSSFLCRKLHHPTDSLEGPDLKPVDSRSIRQLVLSEVRKSH